MTDIKYPYYVYLHINGTLIERNARVVDSDPEYFDSPMVRKWWKIEKPEDLEKVKEEMKELLHERN